MATCFLPPAVRVALASQQHYGISLTRPVEVNPSAPATFAERLEILPPPERAALRAELAPFDRALAADGRDQVSRVARAALLEKYKLRIDAAIEYRKVLQEWPDAVWIFNRLFDLEDQPMPEKVAPAPAAARGSTYALLVGISKYRSDRITPLLYPARDAALFKDFLTSPRGGSIPEANVEILTDGAATTPAMRLRITDFLKARATRDDTVVLFIAAHGTVETKNGRAYVVTHETDPEDLEGTALPLADLRELFRRELAGVRRAILYLDTCHAGRLGSAGIQSINDAVTPLTQVGGEVFTFMASGKDEKSEEGPQYGGGHGAFSYFLVDALNGSADVDPQDGKVEFNEFVDYVRSMVRKSTERRQTPDKLGDLGKLIMSEISPEKPGLALAKYPAAVEMAMASPPRTRGLEGRSGATSAIETFEAAIEAGRILPGQPDSAFSALPALRAVLGPAGYLEEENKLRVALENKGREVLLRYLRGEQEPQRRTDFTSGKDYFAAAQRLSPESVLLESEKAFCWGRELLFEPKDYSRAANLLERAARLDPAAAYSYNALGIAYLERASYREAEGAFRDAIERAPRWIYPRHNLALAYAERGAYSAAEREYKTAIRLEPRYSYLHYGLGALLQKVGRGKEAGAEYLASIDIDPKRAEAYAGLGVLKAAEGNRVEAERNYRTAMQLNAKLPAAAHDLALLYVKEKRIDLAIRTWVENLELNPDFAPSRMSLAGLYRRQGKLDDAAAQYEAVIAASPNYGAGQLALHETLGDRYRSQNKLDEARREYSQALGIAASDEDRRRIRRALKKIAPKK